MGGDEFAILLIETGKEAVNSLIGRTIKKFTKETTSSDYRETLSVGYVAFYKAPDSSDEALKIADNTMYRAKKNGKNKIEVEII